MFKTKLLPILFIMLLVSCQEKMIFKISEDPGYAATPILSVKALDGDRWIEGKINEETKTVDFEFRVLNDLSAVQMRVELNGKWPKMVSPEETLFEANLQTAFKITVNDGTIGKLILETEKNTAGTGYKSAVLVQNGGTITTLVQNPQNYDLTGLTKLN